MKHSVYDNRYGNVIKVIRYINKYNAQIKI